MKVTKFTPPDVTVVDMKERFVKWVSWLKEVGAIFHLDDDPHDIVTSTTIMGLPVEGGYNELFSPEVADAVEQAVCMFREELGNDEMWEIYFPIASEDEAYRHLCGDGK